ncbi:MAG: hypothetical protein AAF741_03580 [Bacteroidota bacterium]
MSEEHWNFFQQEMHKKIKQGWSKRFKQMMKGLNWTYEDVAKLGGFSSANSVKATISRGLPNFAKVAVLAYEAAAAEKVIG